MKTVRLGLDKMSDADVLEFVNSIITSATGNADFSSPNPTLVALQADFDEGTTCLSDVVDAENALALKRIARDERFAAIRNDVTLFATWAVQKCAGDRMKLQSVGLQVRADATPVGPLPAPGNLRSISGAMTGSIDLEWDPVRGRFNYFLDCAQNPAGPWTTVYTGRASRATCSGLTSGAEYWFQVRAQGAAGVGPWSDVTHKRAS